MNRFLFVTALSTSLALGTLACGGSVAETPATSAASMTKAAVATNAHGPIKLVGDALGEVPLRAEQRTEIEKLAADAETRHAITKTARADLMEAVAAQVEAGKIDRAAIQPKVDAAAQAWESTRPGDRTALERLHAILDPGQRSQFVDALEAKIHAHMEGHPGRAKMEEWATDLKLTDAQKEQIHGMMREHFAAMHGEHGWKEGREKGKKVLEAFKGDHFVMDEIAPPVDAHAKANEMSGKILGILEQVVPVLTPEQRALGAAKIRAHAAEAQGEEMEP